MFNLYMSILSSCCVLNSVFQTKPCILTTKANMQLRKITLTELTDISVTNIDEVIKDCLKEPLF